MNITRKATLFAAAALIAPMFVSSAQAGVREDFLKLIDRPRVPAEAQIAALPDTESLNAFRLTYSSDAADRVPGILLKKPDSAGRRPVIIALHGTGGSKNDELPLLRELAKRGFIGVAIDGRYHGERSKGGKGNADYQDAILRAYRGSGEHPFFYDGVWDVMRLIDYLQTRDDVDPKRIGIYGVSKGGIEVYLSAAADERIAAAVPCIGLESFQWATDNDSWHSRIGTIPDAFAAAAKDAKIDNPTGEFVHQFYAKVAPGLDGEFDGPSMVKLIAPRPLLSINGEIDPRTPMPGLQLCNDAAKAAYHAAGADQNFTLRIQPKTGHRVNPDSQAAAVEWLVQQLKP